jgi:hypothetical protein
MLRALFVLDSFTDRFQLLTAEAKDEKSDRSAAGTHAEQSYGRQPAYDQKFQPGSFSDDIALSLLELLLYNGT